MKTADFNKVYAEAESGVFKFDYQYGDAFNNFARDHEKELTDEQRNILRREVEAFRFSTVDTTQEKNRDRLQPMFGYTNGTEWPDKTKVKEDDLDYYLQRAKDCKNEVMRFRYLDVVWELDKRKSKHLVGIDLVEAAIKAGNVMEHDNELDRVDCLNRALQVSVQLGKTGKTLIEKSTEEIRKNLKRLDNEGNIRYTLELIETVIEFKKLFTQEDIEYCTNLCDKGVEHYSKDNDNFFLREAFINRQFELKQILNPEKDDVKQRAHKLAASQIEEAERRTDSLIVQQHFLAIAQKIYKDAGMTKEAKELGQRIERLGKGTDVTKDFKEFSVTQRIPQEYIDAVKEVLIKNEDTCAVIAISPHFVPSWGKSEESAKKETQTFISDMIANVTYNNDGVPIAITPGDTEYKKIIRYFQTDTELKVTLLVKFLRELINDKTIKLKNFEIQFKKIHDFDDSTWQSIKHGLKKYIQGDTYSASLILTTQLEDFIFRLLPLMEVEQYVQEPDGTYSPKTLKPMLNEIREYIGEDLFQLIFYTLVDKAHHNLRNQVGHGKTKITDEDNELKCVRLIQIFALLLVRLNINKD